MLQIPFDAVLAGDHKSVVPWCRSKDILADLAFLILIQLFIFTELPKEIGCASAVRYPQHCFPVTVVIDAVAVGEDFNASSAQINSGDAGDVLAELDRSGAPLCFDQHVHGGFLVGLDYIVIVLSEDFTHPGFFRLTLSLRLLNFRGFNGLRSAAQDGKKFRIRGSLGDCAGGVFIGTGVHDSSFLRILPTDGCSGTPVPQTEKGAQAEGCSYSSPSSRSLIF